MENKNSDKESLRSRKIFLAKVAEQAERYTEMVNFMKDVVELNDGFSAEERNVLSVGYKNVVGAKRASWRIVTSILNKENKDSTRSEDISKYRNQIEKELEESCNQILELLEKYLLNHKDNEDEANVFYYKMKGDYNRYLAEFMLGEKRKEVADKANEAYHNATVIAEKSLDPANIIRLGLALNYSVFYYEIQNSTQLACEKAKKALEDAVNILDNLSDSNFKESGMILLLLRDNLELWTADSYDEEDSERNKSPVTSVADADVPN